MWYLWLCIGLLCGFMLGVSTAAWSQVSMDKKSVKDGVIKIGGKIYTLKEIEL